MTYLSLSLVPESLSSPFLPYMADGLNDIRAMRVTEIVQDFHALQRQISQLEATSSPEDYHAPGYALLRECISEGHAILQAQFPTSATSPNGDPEQERQHLQYVMLDASARRLQAQRIFLRATAAIRWVNSRNAILNGQRPGPAHQQQLQQLDGALQSELARITDQGIHQQLLATDQQTKWVTEDPSLEAIEDWIQRGFQS